LVARQAVRQQARAGANGIAAILARAAGLAGEPAADGAAEPGRASGLQSLVAELAGGDVREVHILDGQLNPLVSRRVDESGLASGGAPLSRADIGLAGDCIAAGRPVGRFEASTYRVAAPVRRPDGRGAGAVLVAISTASSAAAIWRQAVAGGLAALGIGIPALLAAFWLARSVVAPVRQAVAVAESIAAGDLTPTPAGEERHELGRLLSALGRMTGSLGGLIGRIKTAGEHLANVAPQMTTALANQERAVRSVSRSADEISASVAQISATSEQLLEATGSVPGVAREAAQVANQGRGGLESMAASMQQLDEAMNAFTRKLATISQRASGITAVVTTIAKIADQTNLLSVNATIEAEKAGESGRGFRIVAQEIRRLADQTALATKDIDRMVRDMQTSVSSGTMEMDRFRNEVSARIGEVAEVSGSLGRIIEPVQDVTRSLDRVHQGMEAQSHSARQIRDAMEMLRADAGDSAASVTVLAECLDQFRAAIGELNTEAAKFRTAR
ncbi:MAG: methyl-accepting chemotaxis protein, partial [Planctomycetia bacterium]